ncbi:hypothetical protein EYF80_006639 [Liparis tanakae]|uniref:Uncharacterized protein n=1 Tax=Liparis tanakae TaxID=230148 RepID=A0A4Z2J0G0_9TELE|nr:hypothetical protein EYF80_006639 [Liparis tanakae]
MQAEASRRGVYEAGKRAAGPAVSRGTEKSLDKPNLIHANGPVRAGLASSGRLEKPACRSRQMWEEERKC